MTVLVTEGSLARFDHWKSQFLDSDPGSELVRVASSFFTSAEVDATGVFDPLVEPTAGSDGHYYAEFFEHAPEADGDSLREAYSARTEHAAGTTLHLLGTRIGLLAPDPGIAVWGGASMEVLEPLVRSAPATSRLRATRGAMYEDLGSEVMT
jgi:hypothetical protein